jgi:lysosomal alpha-mannosidase
LSPDQLEVMVHRRLFIDDNYGVDEALNEMAFGEPLVARGKHVVCFGCEDAKWRRNQAQNIYMPPILMFQETSSTLEQWISLDIGHKEFSMLTKEFPLPPEIHLMTVERWLK